MLPDAAPGWATLVLDTCYDLSLHLQPETQSYTGTARITFTNRAGQELGDLVFRTYPNAPVLFGGRLHVTGAAVDGQAVPAEVFLSDETGVRLVLDPPLPDGEMTVVELAFEGELPTEFGSSRAYGIFNYAADRQQMTLATWYPMLAPRQGGQWYAQPVIDTGDAVVSDAAWYRVRIVAPVGWRVAATGSLVESIRHDGATESVVVSGPSRDFAVAAGSQLEAVEVTTPDGTRVAVWGLPRERDSSQEALGIAVDSLEALGRRFGDYPYRELDVVAAPLRNASGVEYPGLILIDADSLPHSRADIAAAVTIAHEVAHQWWYGVVGNDVLESPWQDEALTTYSSQAYLERASPDTAEAVLEFYRRIVEAYQQTAGDEPIAQPLAAFVGRDDAYATIVYLKGALFFDAVRGKIGDDAFFHALRDYYAEYAYAIAPPEALLSAFETACGCDLEALYAEWGVIPR